MAAPLKRPYLDSQKGMLAPGIAFAGGAAAGILAWYALYADGRSMPDAIAFGALLVIALAAGMLGAGAWLWSARTHVFDDERGVRYTRWFDAAKYLAFAAAWPIYIFGGRQLGRSLLGAALLFGAIRLVSAAERNTTLRYVLTIFVTTRVSLLVIALIAADMFHPDRTPRPSLAENQVLAVWTRWDGENYLRIAMHGYHGTEVAFFPLYPLLIRMLAPIVGSPVLAAVAISNLAFFAGLLLFARLVKHDFDQRTARRAVFALAIFPTALFFAAVYTEALFLSLSLACFIFLREERWTLAGIVGFFAAATRVEGVLLVVPFAIEAYAARPDAIAWRAWGRTIAPVIMLVPAGVVSYMAYLTALTGDPLAFLHAQTHWHRRLASPAETIHGALAVLATAHGQRFAVQSIELAFTVLALILMTIIVGRHTLRPSYLAYAVVSLAIPLCTGALMSMPRFLLTVFPLFIILAILGRKRIWNELYLVFALPLLGLFTALFAASYWVA